MPCADEQCGMTIMWTFVGLGIPLFPVMAAELRIRHRGYGYDRPASPSTLMQHLHTTIALVLHACTTQGWQRHNSALFCFSKSVSDVHRENCLPVRSAQSRSLVLFSPGLSNGSPVRRLRVLFPVIKDQMKRKTCKYSDLGRHCEDPTDRG